MPDKDKQPATILVDSLMVSQSLSSLLSRLDNVDEIIVALDKQVDLRFESVDQRLDRLDADHKKLYEHVQDTHIKSRELVDKRLSELSLRLDGYHDETRKERIHQADVFGKAMENLQGIINNSLDISTQARDVAGQAYETVNRQQVQIDSIRGTVERVENLQRDAEERFKLTQRAVEQNTDKIEELVNGQAGLRDDLVPVAQVSRALLRGGSMLRASTAKGGRYGLGSIIAAIVIQLLATLLGVSLPAL